MSSISQYLSDNANAGQCASAYYNNTHTPGGCPVQPGICSVIAFLVVELKNAEQRERTALQAQPLPAVYTPASPPLIPVSPVPSAGSGSHYAPTPDGTGLMGGGGSGGGGSGGTGQPAWGNEGVETRRS